MNHSKDNYTIEYSQNRIEDKKLIERLVNQSGITEGDLVYDIGAGPGAISEALLKKGARVIAFEKDNRLYLECKKKFIDQDRFELYLDDFLIWKIPPRQKYKVFSNIPFFHTADIVNKLLNSSNPPEDCYLIVQKEAAEKYAGFPGDTLASLLIKPIFWVDIIYHFKREDFRPVPSVDIALLQAEQRKSRLLPDRYYELYRDFVILCREGNHGTLKKALKQLFTYSQLKQLSRTLTIDYRSSPASLNFMQYLGLFQFYLSQNPGNTRLSVSGAGDRFYRKQVNRVKTHKARKSRCR